MNLTNRQEFRTFLQILRNAEERVAKGAPDVAARSAETVALCNARLEAEGMTRADLERLAKKKTPDELRDARAKRALMAFNRRAKSAAGQ